MAKIIILGGRSGTSTMAKILQAANFKLWAGIGNTEPDGLQNLIIKNINKPEKIKKAIEAADYCELAKLPEFAFCLPVLQELYPGANYVVMYRPLQERVESAINLGWHRTISNRIKRNKALKTIIEEVTDDKTGTDEVHNTILCFTTMDILTAQFFRDNPGSGCFVKYSDINNHFPQSMNVIAQFLNVSYWENIDLWKRIKRMPHQAGRWQSVR